MTEQPRRSYLNQQTLVPLGLIGGVFLTAVAGTWQLSQTLARLDTESALRFQRLELKVDGVEKAVADLAEDRWTRAEMRAWVDAVASRNPSITLPPIR